MAARWCLSQSPYMAKVDARGSGWVVRVCRWPEAAVRILWRGVMAEGGGDVGTVGLGGGRGSGAVWAYEWGSRETGAGRLYA